jgi:autonomous glycyl radical cofactor GrcA
LRRLLPAILVMSAAVFAQALVFEKEPAPKKVVSAAEPRTVLPVDLDTLMPKLLASDPGVRAAALESLGFRKLGDIELREVRLNAVDLDGDDHLERVLVLSSAAGSSAALVAKREGAGWWKVGEWSCFNPGSREVAVEVRPTVRQNTNDVVVHFGGTFGTNAGERHLAVYRMFRGRLHKVLDTVESESGPSRVEHADVIFPDVEAQDGQRVLRLLRTTVSGSRRTTACHAYQWSPDTFQFARTGTCTP